MSTTVGYDYEASPDPAAAAFIREFYEQVFPVREEREYFLSVHAHALFSEEQLKLFVVLMDTSSGNNGKTTVMRALEAAFGRYKAKTERDFLYESSGTNPNGAAANLLDYAHKRLAFFDEPSGADSRKRLDIRRIKDLVSGDARIRGRYLRANEMQEHVWCALIVIACNESNFPAMDASDRPMVKRIKVLKMRSTFVEAAATPAAYGLPGEEWADDDADDTEADGEADGDPVFEQGEKGFKRMLNVTARCAHMHMLVEAYQRHGGRVATEPACVAEMVGRLLESSDPRVARARAFVDANVDFNPPRPAGAAGKRYYAWLTEKELTRAFWVWFKANGGPVDGPTAGVSEDKRRQQWKKLLRGVMESRGRPVAFIQPRRSGVNAFDRVAWLVAPAPAP